MVDFGIDEKLKQSSILIKDLTYCQLLLKNNKNYPWCILLPKKPNLVELTDLSYEDYTNVNQEVYQIIKLMQTIYKPDKINMGSLGNIVNQLHIHIIARYKSDKSFPLNVWSDMSNAPYNTEEIDKIIKTFLQYLN